MHKRKINLQVCKTVVSLPSNNNVMKKFILYTRQFGFDVFIASESDGLISDKQSGALVFETEFDNPEDKLAYYTSYSGYELEIKYIG